MAERRRHPGDRRGLLGRSPDRRPRRGGARRDHGRAGRRGADRRLPGRPAGEGGDGARAGRPGADDALARRPGEDARARTWSTPPAPAAGPRPSTSRPPPRWSPRRPAARSPSTATAPARAVAAPPTCSRRSASTSTLDPEQVGGMHRRGRLRLHVRPPPPRGDGARDPGPQGARGADDLQLPRPADQPGRAPSRQLLGVSDRHYQETIAEALVGLGSERAMVVAAEDGLDELSISARTRVIEVADGLDRGVVRRARRVRPRAGRARGRRRRHPGGERRRHPRRLRGRARARRDLVLLNAGAAIYVGGRADEPRGGRRQGRRGDRHRRGRGPA